MSELLLLDTSEGALLGETAIGSCGCEKLRIDLLAGKGRFDNRLALFDHPGAGFGCGGERGGCNSGAGTGDEPGGGIAGPGDEPE